MKLSEVFQSMVDKDVMDDHACFMVFSGTMTGKVGKNGMPVKVAGLVCQEFNVDEYIRSEEVDIELLSCVAVAVNDVEGIETVGQLKKAVERIESEDARRIIATLELLEDTKHKLYRYDDTECLDVNVGIFMQDSATVTLPDAYEVQGHDGLANLSWDMCLCRGI